MASGTNKQTAAPARSVHIETPALFSFPEAMRYTTRGFDDPRYVVEGGTVATALRVEGHPIVIRVSETAGGLLAERIDGGSREAGAPEAGAAASNAGASEARKPGASGSNAGASRLPEGGGAGAAPGAAVPGERTEAAIGAHVRRWFDLDRDLTEWQELVRAAESPLREVFSELEGFRLVALPSLFEALSWCVLGQQINLAFAYRLKRRLSERFADRVAVGDRRYYLFPEPARLAAAHPDELRGMQLSYRKAEYLIGLAELFRDGELTEAGVERLGSTNAMMERLERIRGIGAWSAGYGLLKGLSRRDAVPYGDAGLGEAYRRLYGTTGRPSKRELDYVFSQFPGWEGYAAFYLWRSLLYYNDAT